LQTLLVREGSASGDLKVRLSRKSDLEKKAIVKGEAITSSKLIKIAMPPTIEMEISANKLFCTSR